MLVQDLDGLKQNPSSDYSEGSAGGLRKNALGTTDIFFSVMALNAPLAVVVLVVPAIFVFGNGVGVTGAFFLIGLLYLIYACGFTAMSRFLGGAGGSYTFITAGLNRASGGAGLFLMIASFLMANLSTVGNFGILFNDLIVRYGGPGIQPWIYTGFVLVALYFCAVRKIEFGAKVLGICLVAEIAILLLMVFVVGGNFVSPDAVGVAAFSPGYVFGPGAGIAFAYIALCYVGFDISVTYREETRDQARSIPRATYLAVIVITFVFMTVTWAIASYYGQKGLMSFPLNRLLFMVPDLFNAILGPVGGISLSLLLTTSLFATGLSLFNALNRYLYALSRDGLLWTGFKELHPAHNSPYKAARAQGLLIGLSALFIWMSGADFYLVTIQWLGPFYGLGVMLTQVLVSLAVIRYFWRNSRGVNIWLRLVAPAIAALGLVGCIGLQIWQMDKLTGVSFELSMLTPVAVVLVALCGIFVVLWTRRSKPEVYNRLGQMFD